MKLADNVLGNLTGFSVYNIINTRIAIALDAAIVVFAKKRVGFTLVADARDGCFGRAVETPLACCCFYGAFYGVCVVAFWTEYNGVVLLETQRKAVHVAEDHAVVALEAK